MTIEELIVYGKKTLPSVEAKFLLANLLQMDSLELLNHLNEIVTLSNEEEYKKLIDIRKNDVPFQYLVGTVNFYGYEYIVNKNVLIPRFETEELVEHTLKFIDGHFNKEKIQVIDLGCGSGVIGLTLKKKRPLLDVSLVDISSDALKVAKENSDKLKVEANFICSDMLKNVKGRFDVIISNPPYIGENEQIEDIVYKNEPHIALFGGEDGLRFYRDILANAKGYLNEQFLIAFEIGYMQKDAISDLANKYFDNIRIICQKDLSGKDRMLFITNI